MSRRAAKVADWTRPSVRALKPYYKAPLDSDPLRLDQNTHLHDPNPAAGMPLDALDLTQYPTRDADSFRLALAGRHGGSDDDYLAANGSDELLDIVVKAFTKPGDRLAVTAPSYSLYPFYAALGDLDLATVPLTARFGLDVDAMLATHASLTVVASPNNPTGNRFPAGELERLVEDSSGVVVIDEAYIEYAGEQHSFLQRVHDYDNLIVLRTMSKAYGLAGIRVGYLSANADLMARLLVVKPPFNVGLPSETIAAAALQETAWLQRTVTAVQEERVHLAARLKEAGLRPHPTDANFILCDAQDPLLMQNELLRRGILARTFAGKPGLDQAIRFTVGQRHHSDQLLQAIVDINEAFQ